MSPWSTSIRTAPRSRRETKRRYSTGSAKNFRSRRACTRGRTISGCGHLGHTMHLASSGRTGARDKDRECHQGPRRHSAQTPKRIAGFGSRTNHPAHNETLSPSDSRSSPSPGLLRRSGLRAHHVSLRLHRVRQLLQSGITVLLRDGGAAVAGADGDHRIHVIPCETHGRGIRHQTPRRGLTRRPTRGERDRVTYNRRTSRRTSIVGLHQQTPSRTNAPCAETASIPRPFA